MTKVEIGGATPSYEEGRGLKRMPRLACRTCSGLSQMDQLNNQLAI